jgi:hypothetical protein
MSKLNKQTKTQRIVNVFGEMEEACCTNAPCYHPFSWHGGGNPDCECQHASNAAVGVKELQ